MCDYVLTHKEWSLRTFLCPAVSRFNAQASGSPPGRAPGSREDCGNWTFEKLGFASVGETGL